MHWIFTLSLCVCATFALQINYKVAPPLIKRFERAVIFGDSTSDTGNVYNLTNGKWPIVPPYYQGRYSNGPNWADRLNVPVKFNYAYGSATTDSTFVQGLTLFNTLPVPGLRQEVAEFTSRTKTFYDILPTAYIVWGGANDFIYNPSLAANPLSVVNSLMNSVKDLLAAGVKDLIVFNFGPAQLSPSVNGLSQAQISGYAYLTSVVNNALNSSLAAIKVTYPDARIYLFNLNSLITYLVANPPPPVTNVVNNCWSVANITTVIQNCTDPRTYFFIDTFHFTTPVQKKLAEAVDPFFIPGFTPNAAGSYFYAY